jgi:DNA repair protein RadD
MSLDLRPYQTESIEALRAGVRDGHKRQILCAPTGSGKTVCATFLMEEASRKLSRAWFIVDRVALVNQTSSMFDAYGIQHGVIQAQHWRFKPWERVQVISAQTLARRKMRDEKPNLIIVDEAHTLYKSTVDFIKANPEIITIGLTATPFTKGLGQLFTNVVNVTTTDKLLDAKYLAPLRVYAGKMADMTGAKTKFDGEWEDREIETRGLQIIGDVVAEWIAKTQQHFNGPVKTIAFSATVAHGEELCRRFQDAGFNFQQVSYRDGNDERRSKLIEEFRKPDSDITGLVSCEALAKGFDVPDILCGIAAKPYRKSLSGHIQQVGRAMRSYPGKEYALWLDHAGNWLRFMEDADEFFASGVPELRNGELDAKIRPEPDQDDKTKFACGACHFIMGGRPVCPMCGWERPKRMSMVEELDGELREVTGKKSKATQLDQIMEDRETTQRMIWGHALDRKSGDVTAAEKFALAQWHGLYGGWPRRAFRNIEPLTPHPVLVRKVQSRLIAWARGRKTA